MNPLFYSATNESKKNTIPLRILLSTIINYHREIIFSFLAIFWKQRENYNSTTFKIEIYTFLYSIRKLSISKFIQKGIHDVETLLSKKIEPYKEK